MHDDSYLFLFDSVENVNNLFFPGLEFLLLLTKSVHLCLGKEERANLWYEVNVVYWLQCLTRGAVRSTLLNAGYCTCRDIMCQGRQISERKRKNPDLPGILGERNYAR